MKTCPSCGGVNAFLHYENGKTKPPLALPKLLGVLDRFLTCWHNS